MRRRRLTVAETVIVTGFTVGCFALLLFLWSAFGGDVPLRAHGYRVSLIFPDAAQLASNADVRISGVPVGKVVDVRRTANDGAHVQIELERRFAPLRRDARAVLRQKSLLGETYIELSPGTTQAAFIRENGALPRGRIAPAVALDEVYRVLDTPTRAALQSWMQAAAGGLAGRGRDLNGALGLLAPFVDRGSDLAEVLAEEDATVTRLVRDSGTALDALGRHPESIGAVVRGGAQTFGGLAAQRASLAAGIRALPPFEREVRDTVGALSTFAADATPRVQRLVPTVTRLGTAATRLVRAAPGASQTLGGLARTADASRAGFPALEQTLTAVRPALRALPQALPDLLALSTGLSAARKEIIGGLGNARAATSAGTLTGGRRLHYLRTSPTVQLESLAAFPRRPGTHRSDPYRHLGVEDGGLVFDARSCSDRAPVITGPPSVVVSEAMIDLLTAAGVSRRGEPGESAQVAAPPCLQQGPFVTGSLVQRYPQSRAATAAGR